ncbi:lysis system i-spanin subunit Rz [Advenella kashmirensis]|nr:lysis system i-spanin subunit Rz [Advenella kashmirensis]
MTAILSFINGIRGYLILALVAVSAGLLYGWSEYRQGYRDHETFAKLQTAILNEAARQKEQALQAQVNDLDTKHYQEYQNAQKTIAQLRTDVADGKRRLSIRVKQPICASKDAEASRLDNGTARADIDGQDAQDLIGIVIEGDQAILQLNALQDWAELIAK